MRFLEVTNLNGLTFKLNLDLVASFALSDAKEGSTLEGTLNLTAGGTNYSLNKESADLFLAAVENDVLLAPAVDCPVVQIGFVSSTKPD
jgi:hypothetical protein